MAGVIALKSFFLGLSAAKSCKDVLLQRRVVRKRERTDKQALIARVVVRK
jgi:hypothetical protein